MSNAHYKWLIVVEGSSDVTTFTELLKKFGVNDSEIKVKYAGGVGKVYRLNNWGEKPSEKDRIISQFDLHHDQGRPNFMGAILVVDSDEKGNLSKNFAEYSQSCRSALISYVNWRQPQEITPSIMRLDTIKGVDSRELPIYGLCVPASGQGCIETDLLQAYGYPANEEDYDSFASNIRLASQSWCADKPSNGNEWWNSSRNGKARMDKFMYVALKEGFETIGEDIKMVIEPQIITDIKYAMSLELSTS